MSDRRTTNFSQKGFQGNLLAFMKKLEKNGLCCLDFLEKVYTQDSSSIHFSGTGIQSDPLIASSKISASLGNSIVINPDGLFVLSPGTIVSSATTLTLSLTTRTYIYKGAAAAVWTMPTIAGNTNKEYIVKNAGTGTLQLVPVGTDNFFDTVAIPSIILLPGDSYIINDDGTFWNLI